MAYFKIGKHAVVHGLEVHTEANGTVVEITSRLYTEWSRWDGKKISPGRAYRVRLPYPGGPKRKMAATIRPCNLRKLEKPNPQQRKRRTSKPREPDVV